MGQCKRCGGIYRAHEMTEGICKNCLKSEDITDSKKCDVDNFSGEYKTAIVINLSIVILILLLIVAMYENFVAEAIQGFSIVLIPILFIVGNILSITVIFKLLNKKEYSNRLVYLIISLAIPYGIIMLALWSLKGANFHA